jgi:general secretion pathway protein M
MGSTFVLDKYRAAQSHIAELEPRYARLQGMRASRQELDESDAKAAALLTRFAYPSTQEVTQAGNDAQQRLRTIFAGAGLEVVSSQVLPAKTEKEFDRIPLSVRVDGELLGLQSALVVLSSQTPAVMVEALTVQAIGAVRPDKPQRLSSQFTFYVLRVRP